MFDYQVSKHPHFDEACRAFALRHNLVQLAERAGMNVQILRNKLNPAQPHLLTAPEIWLLTDLTEDSTLVDGFLAQIHCLPCVPINEVAKEKLPHYVMSATAEKRTSLIWSWTTPMEKSCCRAVGLSLRWRWAGRDSRFSRKGHSRWTRLNTLAHRIA